VHLLRCCIFISHVARSGSFLSSFSFLSTFVVDLKINFLISSITSSNCYVGWFLFFILTCCTYSLLVGRSHRSPMLYSSSLVTLAGHSVAVPLHAGFSLLCRFSASSSNKCAPVISLVLVQAQLPSTSPHAGMSPLAWISLGIHLLVLYFPTNPPVPSTPVHTE
jgi:hypothetical protein